MDYLQILSPIHNFLHCKTPQAWLDKARAPANLPLLLTDHLVCELKAAQTAMLLVRKYVADKQGSQALLDWLKPYEAYAFREGDEPDFIALNKQISKSVMPQTDDPWGRKLIDSMVLLIKEELHHFWQVREAMMSRNIPYVKITASRYAKGMLKEVRTHEPLTLIDKLICGLTLRRVLVNGSPRWRRIWMTIYRHFIFRCCDPRRGTIRTIWRWHSRFLPTISVVGCGSLASRSRIDYFSRR